MLDNKRIVRHTRSSEYIQRDITMIKLYLRIFRLIQLEWVCIFTLYKKVQR